jgi:hypothetical protein
MNVDPRGVGTLRVDIQAGDPLSSLLREQKREQEEACRAQEAQRRKRRRGVKTEATTDDRRMAGITSRLTT